MKKALIQGERICEFGEEFPVHKDLQWVDVPDDTTEQDTYVDGAVVKQPDPTPLTWEEARRNAYSPLGDQLDNITKVFKFLKVAGIDIGSDGDAQTAMSDAVKADNPKPEE